MPRSASNSSTSLYDRRYRRYHRTAKTITSGGNLKPAKPDLVGAPEPDEGASAYPARARHRSTQQLLRAHHDGAILAASDDDLDELIGSVAAEANHEPNR